MLVYTHLQLMASSVTGIHLMDLRLLILWYLILLQIKLILVNCFLIQKLTELTVKTMLAAPEQGVPCLVSYPIYEDMDAVAFFLVEVGGSR